MDTAFHLSHRSTASLLAGLICTLPAVSVHAQTGNAFIDDAKAGLVARSSYFDRRSAGDGSGAGNFRQQGWGLGGWLYGNTGEIGQVLSFGAAYDFVVPLHAPSDTSYNYILRDPGQDAVSALGEINAKLRLGNHALVVGRQSINQAWYMEDVVRFYNKLDQSMIGRRDVRAMHPIQYEAATVQGRLAEDTVRYYGGYVWKARQINDNQFRNLYSAAYETTCWESNPTPCSKQGDSDGAAYAGLQWKPNKNMMLEGSYYAFQDMLNMVYVDFDYVFRLADKNYVRLGTQYMYQSGNGANRITGGRDFSTDYWGVYGEVRLLPWLIPYAMAGMTSKDEDIRSPYSIGPSYLVQRIGENSKAGERTWIVGAIFDFGSMGAKGLQFDMNYGQRRNRHTVTAAGASKASDWDELATDLVYIFPQDGFFKNLRARARYAKVWETGGPLVGEKRTDDIRFDLGLNIPFN
ncbi:OprD family outer membrane porin [uncultured Dechloromonas sp.]|uniref:OprD family outer membrane porin n=1 Tax=uncultured Dechloromonas sp. TaxID=171719 RepID=UPI0025FEB08B|nr:OprD family outer membrane porin [uncultured Dechloromonas sp.]